MNLKTYFDRKRGRSAAFCVSRIGVARVGVALLATLFVVACSKDTPPVPAPSGADAAPTPPGPTAPSDAQAPPAATDVVPTGGTATAGATPEELVAARAAWKPTLPPNKIDVVPAPDVDVMPPDKQNQVVVAPDSLRFPAAAHPDVLTWAKGRVLVSAPADKGAAGKNPFGFARKVERVEQVGDELVVTTTAAALEEIIHGEFQLEFDLATAQEVEWADFAANAEWAAAKLYTNSLPTFDHYPDRLRDDAPASGQRPPGDKGDPFCCVPSFISDAASYIGDKVSSAANVVVNTAKSAGAKVVDAAKVVGGAVVDGAKALGGAVSDGASAATRTVTSISKAIYEDARALYEAIMPKSFEGTASLEPEFEFDAIDLSIVKYKFDKTLNESGDFPMKASFEADSNLKGSLSFTPKLSVGAQIPNPIAIGDIPPLRVWLDVDAALTAKLTLDLMLEASLSSAGGKAGSELEEALNQLSDFAGPVLNTFRKETFGNEDVKPAGNWKKTVFLSKPKVELIMLGKIPVVLTGTFQIDIDCGFELKAELEAEATLESVHTFNYRAEYVHGVGMSQKAPKYEHTPRTTVKVLGGGEASVACSVIPRINVFLYDTAGLNAGVRGSVIASAKYESECNAASTRPKGEVSLSLKAGIGIPVGARIQVPGSSWGGKAALDEGIDIGPFEIWNDEFKILEKTWDVPGLGYCTATCDNGLTSDKEPETDLDCGGECPEPCALNKRCKVNSDCASDLFCVAGTCTNDHCTDGVLSGNESGIDCGGPKCAPCQAGGACNKADDCASKACRPTKIKLGFASVKTMPGKCEADPCSDGQRSPGECGVDCGGKCPLCPVGAICGDPKQCASGQSNRYQCTQCGGFGDACCANASCTGGLVCQTGACQCPADRGIACGAGCCAAGQLCQNGQCVDPAPGCFAFPSEVRATCVAGSCPASCRAILQANPGAQSGTYTVQPDPAQAPFVVRCDMSLDGGGWTLVGFEPAGAPAAKTTGAIASLFAETGGPGNVASGAGAGFIGPRFSFARGNYTHLRLNWCDPATSKNVYQSFRTSEEIFADGARAANGTIVLSEFQSNDSVLNQQIPTPDSARFCRARTSTLRPGDTSWGIKAATESNFACGCNSGGWAGVGSYYGGTGEQCTTCSCFGGGWAGTAGNGVPKGDVSNHTFYLWVR